MEGAELLRATMEQVGLRLDIVLLSQGLRNLLFVSTEVTAHNRQPTYYNKTSTHPDRSPLLSIIIPKLVRKNESISVCPERVTRVARIPIIFWRDGVIGAVAHPHALK